LPAAIVAVAVAVVIVIALGQLGGATSSARTEREVVTASKGIVQSTVTGTGNVEPVTEEDVDFQTSGTLRHVYVKEGAHVNKGQLLATLGDTSAALTLEQARATLSTARATLTSDEQELADSSDTSDTIEQSAEPEYVDYSSEATTSTTDGTSTKPTSTTTTTSTEPTRTTTTTEPTDTTDTTSQTETTPSETGTTSTPSSTTSGSSDGGASSSASTVTDATIDSDRLGVLDDEQTVRDDETALSETKLRAPVSGTITSLEDLTPGDTVSSGSDSSSSGDSSSSSDSSSADTTTAASSSDDSSSSSSSAFAEIDSLRHLSMAVSFTEADIGKLKVGQPATVTIDALSGVELAAKVTSVDQMGTTSSDVVSYDATLTLTQHDARVKPGMSASASVIVGQAHGVTAPTDAISGSGSLSTVTEDVNGRDVKKKVIVGTRGDSRAVIVSGLKAGSEVVITETLPATGSSAETSTSQSSASGTLGGSSFGRSSFGGGGFSGPAGGGGPP
jgi:multidrug efflux pump subunit AcrA (membrane-fusion protein)